MYGIFFSNNGEDFVLELQETLCEAERRINELNQVPVVFYSYWIEEMVKV
jgi:hypothetical protein